MKTKLGLMIVSGLLVGSVGADIVVGDKGFDDDDVATYLDVSASTVTAWDAITTGAPQIVDDAYVWSPASNASAPALSGTQIGLLGGGAVYQNFSETYEAGKTYSISYYLLSAWSSSQTTYAYFTNADGSTEYGGDYMQWPTYTGALVQDSWAQFTMEYTATAADAGQNIGFGIWGSAYVYIDDVSDISVVPEPATLGLVGVVGGAMLAIRRKLMI